MTNREKTEGKNQQTTNDQIKSTKVIYSCCLIHADIENRFGRSRRQLGFGALKNVHYLNALEKI